MYEQVVDGEIEKFEGELNALMESITNTITDLKQSIRSQLE